MKDTEKFVKRSFQLFFLLKKFYFIEVLLGEFKITEK